MHKGKFAYLPWFVLSALLTQSLIGFPLTSNAQTGTIVYVDPAHTATQIDTSFSLNITIANVTDLCSWQISIYFLNQILEATQYAEGPFISSHGTTMFDGQIENNYNTTHGRLWMYCIRTWPGTGVDGSGTLANVTLKAKYSGSSPLNLFTILGNSSAQRISHSVQDGTVEVGKHDLSIDSVVPNKTIVSRGYCMKINVNATNQGKYTETFNATVYANMITIETQTVNSMPNGTSAILAFIWNTTGFAYGNYAISAYAWPVPGETDTANNNFTDGTVLVTIPGDINGDKKVNILDAIMLANSFNSKPGDPNWNPNADINGDDKINILDAIVLGNHFNQQWT